MDPGKVSAGIGSSAPGGDYYWMAPRCIALLLACDQRRVLVSNLGLVRFSAGHRWMSTVRSGRATDLTYA